MIKKISIVGAGGVGSTLAFNILARINLDELVLVDICPGLAKGVALDLEDTRGFLHFSTDIKGGDKYSLIKDSEIVVVTAGIARKKGMTRLDLLKINSEISKTVANNIKHLAPRSIVIAVTNPLDLITYVLTKTTGFPRQRVFGMGSSLDSGRLFNILHKTIGVSSSSCEGFVYGAHSKDMIVSRNRIKVKGQDPTKVFKNFNFNDIRKRVQSRGAEIVSFLKNKSANFAPALACCQLIEAVNFDKNEVIPVSVLLKGEYGLKDICLGVPCVVNRNGIEKILEIPLTSFEKKELQKTGKLFRECMM